jgi:adenine-specific DNA-methyltransferase
LQREGRVVFELQEDGRVEAYRIIPSGTETETAQDSILDSAKVKTTAHGSKELSNLFGKKPFDYPKPTTLIKHLLDVVNDKDMLVLDSFAGSGTTAQAVLELNAEDGGSRKFILIEQEDYADTVTAERVRRVIKGVKASKDESLQNGLGGAFTYYMRGAMTFVTAKVQ